MSRLHDALTLYPIRCFYIRLFHRSPSSNWGLWNHLHELSAASACLLSPHCSSYEPRIQDLPSYLCSISPQSFFRCSSSNLYNATHSDVRASSLAIVTQHYPSAPCILRLLPCLLKIRDSEPSRVSCRMNMCILI